jgi:hypothetical protein
MIPSRQKSAILSHGCWMNLDSSWLYSIFVDMYLGISWQVMVHLTICGNCLNTSITLTIVKGFSEETRNARARLTGSWARQTEANDSKNNHGRHSTAIFRKRESKIYPALKSEVTPSRNHQTSKEVSLLDVTKRARRSLLEVGAKNNKQRVMPWSHRKTPATA